MDDKELIVTVYAVGVTVLIVSIGFIVFLHFFSLAKRKALIEKQEKERDYQRLLNEAGQEVRQETLERIGRDLHDNVGQLLTVAKINLHAANKIHQDSRLTESETIIKQAANEMRNLARSMTQSTLDKSLDDLVRSEAARLNSIEGIEVELRISNEGFVLNKGQDLIVFRVLQEFINNSLKHASASHISIDLMYLEDELQMVLKDNGRGFELSGLAGQEKSGLANIEYRLQRIGATHNLESRPGKGTKLSIELPLLSQV